MLGCVCVWWEWLGELQSLIFNVQVCTLTHTVDMRIHWRHLYHQPIHAGIYLPIQASIDSCPSHRCSSSHEVRQKNQPPMTHIPHRGARRNSLAAETLVLAWPLSCPCMARTAGGLHPSHERTEPATRRGEGQKKKRARRLALVPSTLHQSLRPIPVVHA